MIDSRNRDLRSFPSPNHYEVILDNEIKDVVTLRLSFVDIPCPGYNVNISNNILPIRMGSSPSLTFAEVEPGEYDSGADLVVAVETALNIAAGTQFVVVWDAMKDQIVISSGQTDFALLFSEKPTKTMARVLGFEPGVDVTSVEEVGQGGELLHTARAPFRVDMWADKRFIVMNMWNPAIELIFAPSPTVDRAFTVLSIPRCRKDKQQHIMLTDSEFASGGSGIKKWTPPLSRLRRIGVTFRDEKGILFDFQNQDHRLEFVVDTLPITQRYNC